MDQRVVKQSIHAILHLGELKPALDHWYSIRHTWSRADDYHSILIHRAILPKYGIVEFPK